MQHYDAIIYFGVSFGLCACLTPLIRKVSLYRGWIARPSNERWHKKATALMGGIAIFLALSVPLIMMADFAPVWRNLINALRTPLLPSFSAILLIGASILFAIGLFDDFRNVKPHNKLISQILVASAVVFFGYRLHWFHSLTLDTIATLFWIVGITNAFNLIDNMDGLCVGVGLVATLSLSFLFHNTSPEAFLVALALAGALGGFLIYNFHPAKIFMGDCGSLVVGFSISLLCIYYSGDQAESTLSAIVIPILIVIVPILDTSMVTLVRILSGRKASVGGRDHTSHRLVLMGFSERKAVVFLYGVGGISGFAALFVSQHDSLTSPSAIIPVAMVVVLMGVYLSQLRVYPEKEFSLLRDRSFTPVLMELTYKRQLLLVFLDFILVAFAYYLSYRLRFEGKAFLYYFRFFLHSLPAVIAAKLLVFFIVGVYRGLWSYISTSDVMLIGRASLLGTIVATVVLTFIYRFQNFSKGIIIIDWVLTTGLLLGARGSFRLLAEIQNRRTLSGDKVIIYGAGRGGELLLREILNNKKRNVRPIGFIDDDVLKKGKKIQGYEILGTFQDIQKIYQTHQPTGMLISFNSTTEHHIKAHKKAKDFCMHKGLYLKRFKIVLDDIISG